MWVNCHECCNQSHWQQSKRLFLLRFSIDLISTKIALLLSLIFFWVWFGTHKTDSKSHYRYQNATFKHNLPRSFQMNFTEYDCWAHENLTWVSGICRVENRFRKESSRFSGGFFCMADDNCTVVRSFIHLWFDLVLLVITLRVNWLQSCCF